MGCCRVYSTCGKADSLAVFDLAIFAINDYKNTGKEILHGITLFHCSSPIEIGLIMFP